MKISAGAAEAALRSPRLIVVVPLFGLLLVAGLWFRVLHEIDHSRENALAAELRETSAYVESFAQYVRRVLAEYDRTLQLLKAETERTGQPELERLRELGLIQGDAVNGLAIINGAGKAIAYSADTPANGAFTDRAYFRHHAATDDGAMYISQPVVSRFNGRTIVIVLSRRLNGRDGAFDGVVTIAVSPDLFTDFFLQARLRGRGMLGVFGLDGVYRAKISGRAGGNEKPNASPTVVEQALANPSGAYVGPSPNDGVSRLIAYRRLPDYPLVVMATQLEDDALADHNAHAATWLRLAPFTSAALVLFFAVLTGVVYRLQRKTRELRTQRAFLGELLDNIPVGVSVRRLVAGGEGEYVLWNDTNAVLYTRAKDDALGRTLASVAPPDTAGRICEWDREMLSSPAVQDTIEPERLPDGSERQIHRVRAPLFDDEHKPAYVITVSEDITRRKEVEDELLRASAVFETTADGIVITDFHDVVVSINAGFTRLTGFTADEMIGKPVAKSPFAPVDPEESCRRIQQLNRERSLTTEVTRHHRDGRLLDLWLTATVVADPSGRIVNYIRIFTDISPVKDAQRRLEQLAHYDTLTGLPNRRLFADRLEQALLRGARAGRRVGLMFIDLDGFKRVNDECGHDVGDELLRQVAARLSDAVRQADSLCRLGGDEFTVIVENPDTQDITMAVSERIQQTLARPFDICGHALHVWASIGIAVYPTHGADSVTLIGHADAAMYVAKHAGGDRTAVYEPPVQRLAGVGKPVSRLRARLQATASR